MTTIRSAHPYVGSGFLGEWLHEKGKFTTGGICFRFIPSFTVTGLQHQIESITSRALTTPLGRVRFTEARQLVNEPCTTWYAMGEVCGFAERNAEIGDTVELVVTRSEQDLLVGHIKTMGRTSEGLAIHDVDDVRDTL